MAQKKITDLQLRGSVIDTLNLPADDTSQTYRITVAQLKAHILGAGSVAYSNLASAVQALLVPTGSVLPFTGTTAPTGFLLCNGASVSRTTYAALYAVTGNAYGTVDASSFNLPDFRGQFLRGLMSVANVTGTGTASGSNATFTAHGYNRTGVRVRLSSGTLTGLAVSTDYYAIVVDANTLAFATSYANAIANTKISISGANSAVIMQWLDPDATSRIASTVGAGSGNNLGAVQEDAFKSHTHNAKIAANIIGSGSNTANISSSGSETANYIGSTGGTETRPTNVTVNYIIKI